MAGLESNKIWCVALFYELGKAGISILHIHIHVPTRNITKETRKLEIIESNIIFTLTLTFNFTQLFPHFFLYSTETTHQFFKWLVKEEF